MEHAPTVGGVPQVKARRWTKGLAVAAGVLAILMGVGFATGLITVYDAPANAGVVIGWNCTNVGLEWRGDPGFFTDSCS